MNQKLIDFLFLIAFFIHVYNIFLYATTNAINWIAAFFTPLILFIILYYKRMLKMEKIEVVE